MCHPSRKRRMSLKVLRDLQGSYSQHRPSGQGCLLLGFRAGVLPRASGWLLTCGPGRWCCYLNGPADRTLSLWGLSYSLKIWRVFSDGFGLEWELWPLSSSWFLPFGMERSIPWLSQHCILEADNLTGFTAGGAFYLRMTHNSSFMHAWFRWDFGLGGDAIAG